MEKSKDIKKIPVIGKENNGIIDFEGTIVKPNKSGVYKCPFHCGDPRYSLPKWKTEKGFRQHMEKCPKRPFHVNSIKEKETVIKELFDKMKEELIPTLPYTIGQKLIYVKEIILKPTHVQRGNRMVKVRYEAVKDFQAREEELKTIDVRWLGFVPKNLEDMKHYILLNNHISPSDYVKLWKKLS
jgi:hypothetical protein